MMTKTKQDALNKYLTNKTKEELKAAWDKLGEELERQAKASQGLPGA